ncbi:hypothetical protein PV05_06224 [Exophiala xenobiotica]|uniref:O-methyltransferase C-terminal domain-containing protein n=1 Tax=Exophiala xenobiotica TaxID=348802 RepID=A0A0D2CUP4_9EURO|nr:uncharacterized protein PV05_06224 [Exophiala xenobiotica]KIW53812.1 hypothetical protein PV05_06224 [Exophiala xenobiotica]
MAPDQLSLQELAESITQNARLITDMLNERRLPQPSFASDSPVKFPEGNGSDKSRLQEARMSLLTSTLSLEQLVTGPQDFIMWQSLTVMHDLFVLQALERFGVFNAVPIDGDISYNNLAAGVPLNERQLRRIIRHAMTKNIFTEPRPDHVAHNAFSIAPIKNPLLQAWIGHNLGEMLVASAHLGDAIAKYGDTEDMTETGMSLGFHLEGKSIWEWFVVDDDEGRQEKGWRTRRFAQAMEVRGGHELVHIHNGFDWGSLGESRVVDLGGSSGHVSISLAQKFPLLKFVVRDFAELQEHFNEGLPSDLRSRVNFEPGDLFLPQRAQTADVFFLRHILHDWPDTAAIEILRNIINTQDELQSKSLGVGPFKQFTT